MEAAKVFLNIRPPQKEFIMASQDPVVLLEFNELCPSLLDRFMAEGHLPGFKSLYDQSKVYVTEAAEKAPDLDPWMQWITVHSGANYATHRISELGDGYKFQAPRLWDMVSASGRRVWVCGSMNIAYQQPIEGFVVPDPWCTNPPPYPNQYFDDYFRLVQANVRGYTQDELPLSKRDYLSFLRFMMSHGLSLRTVTAIVRQLLS